MTASDGRDGNGNGGTAKNGPSPSSPSSSAGPAGADAPALAIIEAFGGIRPMAKTLGLAVSTVQGWKERSAIPSNRHDQIRAAARDNGIAIDADLLRASVGEGATAQPQVIEGQKVEGRKSEATAAGAGPRGAGKPAEAPVPRRRSAFVPGLAAGVILAVAVAGATIYTQPYWGPILDRSAGSPAGAAATAVGDLEARIEALESAASSDSAAASSALGERVGALEAAVSQGTGQDPDTRTALESLRAELARVSERIAAAEQDLTSLRSRAGTPSEEIVNRLGSESQRLDAMLAQQTELAGRIAAVEAELNAVEAAGAGMPGGRETLLLLATLQLRDALQGSGPYAEPLAMLKNLAEGDSEVGAVVEALERRAPVGLPTLRDLQARFPEVARRIAAIDAGNDSEGWSAGVLRRLSQVVNLRPVGLAEGDSPSAVAARAEVKLNDGDLAGALSELDALEGAAAEAAASWRADAEARLAADRAVSRLGALLSEHFASMAGG